MWSPCMMYMSAFSRCDTFALSSKEKWFIRTTLCRNMQKRVPSRDLWRRKKIMMMSLYPLWLYRWLKKLSHTCTHTRWLNLLKSKSQFHLLTKSFFSNFLPLLPFSERKFRQFRKLGAEEIQLQSQWQWGNMKNFLIFLRLYKKSFFHKIEIYSRHDFRLQIFTFFLYHHHIAFIGEKQRKKNVCNVTISSYCCRLLELTVV